MRRAQASQSVTVRAAWPARGPSAAFSDVACRLVATGIDFAQEVGYRRMVLWTNHPLVAAREIYLRAGFGLVSEEAHHSYGVDLVDL